jgi:tRNA(fMet)-specific endonuclease VapC
MSTAGSVLLDTTVVVAYYRGDETLRFQFAESKIMYVPWVVLGELHFGAQRAQRPQQQLANIRDLLTFAAVLFPDQSTTEHIGKSKAELARLGRPIPDNDLWIAAIARQHGLPVATRDEHFTYLPGLETLAW